MNGPVPDQAGEDHAGGLDEGVPREGDSLVPLVGLGGSAGAIEALQAFFAAMPADSGMAFAVVVHLSPDRESGLPEVLRHCTRMPVVAVSGATRVAPDTVYVIPARHGLKVSGGTIDTTGLPPGRSGHFVVDIFFRTLADSQASRCAAVVLSGADGDGAAGVKRVKEQGGLTVAQDPAEAGHDGMPRSAIATGMVDWVLPARDMPARLLDYFRRPVRLKLPPEQAPEPGKAGTNLASDQEAALREVLTYLRNCTGRDFAPYKRATILRRIARRMQINALEDIPQYLDCLRTHPGEAQALLQDLLISVTNFFRDTECFEALEREIPRLFASKVSGEPVRVWVPACATGEEAYSIAMMLSDHARVLGAPPPIQVFATDLDADAIRYARQAVYPAAIEADVPEERLRRHFTKEHRGYRLRREVREMVLFAVHDVLKDSPFSRLDLVSCRNLLIYLNREAQARVLDTFHFALRPRGWLFLGSSEFVDESNPQFGVVDKKHRIFMQRPTPRNAVPVPLGTASFPLSVDVQPAAASVAAAGARALLQPVPQSPPRGSDTRGESWGEVHLRLLEMLAPPSILVDAEHEIIHLSPAAGRFLHFEAGEPSRDLLRCVPEALRIELRAALFKAAQGCAAADMPPTAVELGGERVVLAARVVPVNEAPADMFLVLLQPASEPGAAALDVSPGAAEREPVARQLDRELQRLKSHLRDTVEQYEASAEELKASNEELQAMNEELRSATEELETSREELQSINEELTTVNHELKHKVDELGHANSDMQNLMDATAIATVFLDRELRITRYTPSAVALFNFIPSDVGRPLNDLKTPLEYADLGADAARVLEKLIPVEREVRHANGNWYFSRVLPYRTIEDRIAGVVLTFVDITERKHADEVRLWLSSVVAASSDGILSFAPDGTILSWNTGAQRLFGYMAQEAIGQPISMLAGSATPGLESAMERVAAGEIVESEESLGRRKDGTELQVAVTFSPIRDEEGRVIAGTAIVRDVSAARSSEEALRASEERLRLLIENATEFAIFSLDLDRKITTWNSGAQRLLGYSGNEVLGKPADIIFTPEDRAAGVPQKEMEAALADGRAADDRFHLRKDGSRFWASGAAMLMRNAEGEAVGFVKILRDQTTARESREALERSSAELLRVLAENERARAELQAADAAKDRFLAILSHELRNPVASIDSAAEVLLSGSAGEADRRSGALIVQRQARVMKELLDDLLDISRLKLGRLELRRQPTPLSALVQSAVDATKPLLQSAGHRLTVDLPRGEVLVDGDPLRLGQVVSNLLANAARYTPNAGVISIGAKVIDGEVVISVKDNGVGIPKEDIPHLFGMFMQSGSGPHRSHGLGIGLALVKNLVELHGGRVAARSEGPGRGSEFIVTLPVSGIEAARVMPPPPAPVPKVEAKGRRILVADDNIDAGWGMSKLLELAGFRVARVRGGAEAIEEILKNPPDAALIDIGMPEVDGHEVARQVRARAAGKKVVLIAATGWGQEADVREALAAGFDAHLTKPLEVARLVELIDRLGARTQPQ